MHGATGIRLVALLSITGFACGAKSTSPSSTTQGSTDGGGQQTLPLRAPTNVTAVDAKDGSIDITWTADPGVLYDMAVGYDSADAQARASEARAVVPVAGGSAFLFSKLCGESHVIITAFTGNERRSAPAVVITPTLGEGTCWSTSLKSEPFYELASNVTANILIARGDDMVLFRSIDSGQTFTRIPAERAATGPIFHNGQFWFLPPEANTIMTTVDGVSFSKGVPIPASQDYKSLRASNGTPYLEYTNRDGVLQTSYRLNSNDTWVALSNGLRGVDATTGIHLEYSTDLSIRVQVNDQLPVVQSLASYAGDCNRLAEMTVAGDRFYAFLGRVDGADCSAPRLTSVNGTTWVATDYFGDPGLIAKFAGKFIAPSHRGFLSSDNGENFTEISPSGQRLYAHSGFTRYVTTETSAWFLSTTGELVLTMDGASFSVVRQGPDWFDGISDGDTMVVLGRAGELAISRDQGTTFVRSSLIGARDGLRGIYKYAPGHYVAFGDLGTLYVTQDSGTTWNNLSHVGWENLSAASGDSSRLYLVSSRFEYSSNNVVVSTDGGVSFTLDDVATAPFSCTNPFRLGSSLYCHLTGTNYITSDGIAWQSSPGLDPGFSLGGDSTRQFMRNSSAIGASTTTNGSTWTSVNWPSTFFARGVARANNKWVAFGNFEQLQISSDAVSWSAQTVGQAGCQKMLGSNSRLVCVSGQGISSLPAR